MRLSHVDVGLRNAFAAPARRLVPFVEGGVTRRSLRPELLAVDDGTAPYEGDVSLSGSGFSLGAGTQYFATPKLALGAGLKWTTGRFDSLTVDDVTVDGLRVDARSVRVNVGLTWYPRGGR